MSAPIQQIAGHKKRNVIVKPCHCLRTLGPNKLTNDNSMERKIILVLSTATPCFCKSSFSIFQLTTHSQVFQENHESSIVHCQIVPIGFDSWKRRMSKAISSSASALSFTFGIRSVRLFLMKFLGQLVPFRCWSSIEYHFRFHFVAVHILHFS